MPIRPYLEGGAFAPEEIQLMSAAFEAVCAALQLGPGAAREREAVAVRIIELARRGERDHHRLVERVIRDAGGHGAAPSLVPGLR